MSILIGMTAGLQTHPALLCFAIEQAGNDSPTLGYAAIYPVAIIAKIIIAQLLHEDGATSDAAESVGRARMLQGDGRIGQRHGHATHWIDSCARRRHIDGDTAVGSFAEGFGDHLDDIGSPHHLPEGAAAALGYPHNMHPRVRLLVGRCGCSSASASTCVTRAMTEVLISLRHAPGTLTRTTYRGGSVGSTCRPPTIHVSGSWMTTWEMARQVSITAALALATHATAATRGAAPPRQTTLPQPPTPLVGRTDELAALGTLFADPTTRLVTIAGSGGMGKTRLAIALAEQLRAAERFSDGVCFVPLAPLDTAEQIVSALAAALDFPLDAGTQPARSPRQQVFDYLRVRRLLLVLDNVEHLLSGSEAGDAGDGAGGRALRAGLAPPNACQRAEFHRRL